MSNSRHKHSNCGSILTRTSTNLTLASAGHTERSQWDTFCMWMPHRKHYDLHIILLRFGDYSISEQEGNKCFHMKDTKDRPEIERRWTFTLIDLFIVRKLAILILNWIKDEENLKNLVFVVRISFQDIHLMPPEYSFYSSKTEPPSVFINSTAFHKKALHNFSFSAKKHTGDSPFNQRLKYRMQ